MATDASIGISLQDKYSTKLKSMAQASTTFERELAEMGETIEILEQQQGNYNKKIAETTVKMEEARRAALDAKKAFSKDGNEANAEKLFDSKKQYQDLTAELKQYKGAANDAGKSIRTLASDAQKMVTGGGGSGGGMIGTLNTLSTTTKTILAMGASQMIGDAVQQVAQVGISSAFGSSMGSMVSSTLSGAISGAVIGSAVPVIGTAIGGAIGAGAGLISGASTVFASQDEAFKSYVQTGVEGQQAAQDASLTGGSALAAGRETDLLSFSTLLGDKGTAASYLDSVKTMANSTPFLYDDLTAISKTLLAYGTAPGDILGNLTSVGDAGSALGLGTQDIGMLATALGRMQSTDKASLEYMNLLTERGISAIDWVAERDGISVAEVYENISKGAYSGKEMADFLATQMDARYGGSMAQQSETFSGKTSTLQGWNDEMDVAMGEGYNETRKAGLDAQIDWLSSESGTMMAEANEAIGAWKASLENSKEEMERAAIKELMTGDSEQANEYALAEATGDAAKMGELIMRAKLDAQNKFNASEGATLMRDSEIALIKGVAEDASANRAYYDAGYKLGEAFSAGRAAANGVSWWDTFLDDLNLGPTAIDVIKARNATTPSNTSSTLVTGNNFNVREEADVGKVAKAITNEDLIRQMGGTYK